MDLQLREGEFNALTVEFFVYLLVQVKVYCPIIGPVYPYTECEVYAAEFAIPFSAFMTFSTSVPYSTLMVKSTRLVSILL